MALPIHVPHQRVAVIQNVNASLLISIYLIATDDAFSVAKDNNARAKATVDPITLPVYLCTCEKNQRRKGGGGERDHSYKSMPQYNRRKVSKASTQRHPDFLRLSSTLIKQHLILCLLGHKVWHF